MTRVSAYARPTTIGEALGLLAHDKQAVVIGGGTRLCMLPDSEPVTVIDLQAIRLAWIEHRERTARVGASTTLQDLVDDDRLPGTIREAARRERPATVRSIGTLGGCVATGDWESELLAALLAHDAEVRTIGGEGDVIVPLSDFLGTGCPRAIITDVLLATDGHGAAARVGRTRADHPIVAAVARRTGMDTTRLAVAGVATVPLLVHGVADIDTLDPPSDFRGSGEYRRSLAATLAARVLEEVR